MPSPTAGHASTAASSSQALAEHLYRTHRTRLLAIARRNCDADEAEEALHDAFILFIDRFDPASESQPLGWLILTLKRRCWATYQRRRLAHTQAGGPERRRPTNHDTPKEAVDRRNQGPQENAELEETIAAVHAQLALLKPSERRALTLLSLGYSYQEICQITGWTYTKVKRSIYEGRLKLRDRVDPELAR